MLYVGKLLEFQGIAILFLIMSDVNFLDNFDVHLTLFPLKGKPESIKACCIIACGQIKKWIFFQTISHTFMSYVLDSQISLFEMSLHLLRLSVPLGDTLSYRLISSCGLSLLSLLHSSTGLDLSCRGVFPSPSPSPSIFLNITFLSLGVPPFSSFGVPSQDDSS